MKSISGTQSVDSRSRCCCGTAWPALIGTRIAAPGRSCATDVPSRRHKRAPGLSCASLVAASHQTVGRLGKEARRDSAQRPGRATNAFAVR